MNNVPRSTLCPVDGSGNGPNPASLLAGVLAKGIVVIADSLIGGSRLMGIYEMDRLEIGVRCLWGGAEISCKALLAAA